MCAIKITEVLTGMNYLSFDGLFYLRYAYVDLHERYLADSLLCRHKIPVRFGDEYVKEKEKYMIVTCKVRKKYRKAFEEAMEELKTKMLLLGYTDYEEFCDNLLKYLKSKETEETA